MRRCAPDSPCPVGPTGAVLRVSCDFSRRTREKVWSTLTLSSLLLQKKCAGKKKEARARGNNHLLVAWAPLATMLHSSVCWTGRFGSIRRFSIFWGGRDMSSSNYVRKRLRFLLKQSAIFQNPERADGGGGERKAMRCIARGTEIIIRKRKHKRE